MTHDIENINELVYILKEKITNDKNYNRNYQEYQDLIINYALSKGYTAKDIYENYIVNGYVYHCFNGAFYEHINTNGIKIKERPWDEDAYQKIVNIFKKHGFNNVFGVFTANEVYDIHFTQNLNSSPNYAVAAPTWFRHFVNNDNNLDAYFNRDYESSLNNIINLIKKYNLTKEESDEVINFFNDCYQRFTSKNPKILLIKRSILGLDSTYLTKEEHESQLEFINRLIYANLSANYILKQDIERSKIEIIDLKKERIKNYD